MTYWLSSKWISKFDLISDHHETSNIRCDATSRVSLWSCSWNVSNGVSTRCWLSWSLFSVELLILSVLILLSNLWGEWWLSGEFIFESKIKLVFKLFNLSHTVHWVWHWLDSIHIRCCWFLIDGVVSIRSSYSILNLRVNSCVARSKTHWFHEWDWFWNSCCVCVSNKVLAKLPINLVEGYSVQHID